MLEFAEKFSFFIGTGILLLQLSIVFIIFLKVVYRKNEIVSFLNKNSILLIFIISLLGIGVSLTYSNIIGFPPCNLCWIQRIFLYPVALLSGLSLLRKENIIFYIRALVLIGGLVGIYQVLLGLPFLASLPACSSNGSCSAQYVFEYGYITIPVMSLTSFAAIYALSLFKKESLN